MNINDEPTIKYFFISFAHLPFHSSIFTVLQFSHSYISFSGFSLFHSFCAYPIRPISYHNVIVISNSSPSFITCFFLISALMGRKYESCFVSNHMAVCHCVWCIVACMCKRPHPSSCHFEWVRISAEISLGTVMKYQPLCPLNFQTIPLNVYLSEVCNWYSCRIILH